MSVELENAPVPRHRGLENAVAVQHDVVEHGDRRLALRDESASDEATRSLNEVS